MTSGNQEKEKPREFDPSRFLVQLPKRTRLKDGSWESRDTDYLPVNARLLWLRTEQPTAKIHTSVVQIDSIHAVIFAEVKLENGAEASGIGMCLSDKFERYCEKAETSALGRALAALGFGTQSTDDFADADDDHLADTPTERKAPPARAAATPMRETDAIPRQTATGTGSAPARHAAPPSTRPASPMLLATEPQIKALFAIGRQQRGMDDVEIDEWIEGRHGVPVQQLTRRQASELIDLLKSDAAVVA